MPTNTYPANRHLTPTGALIVGCFTVILLTRLDQPEVVAQSLLNDNTDHLFNGPSGPILFVGQDGLPGAWFEAQPFKLGGHDNIDSFSIALFRNPDVPGSGTMHFSLWDDNGNGFPGNEVEELAVVDLDSVERLNPPWSGEPELMPMKTFNTPIEDLTPGETYFVVIDWRPLTVDRLGGIWVAMSNDAAGTNRAGGDLYTELFAEPPFEDSDWYPSSDDFGDHQFLQMSVTSADQPYQAIVRPVGTIYHEDFTLGDDGQMTTFMPLGWAFSDHARTKDFDGRDLTDKQRLMNIDTRIFDTSITGPFPASRSLGNGTAVFNAGVPGDSDRALALGVTPTSEDAMLQLVAEVDGGDANSVQLAFDIEAWDADGIRDNPGEAAFNVLLDLDTGAGFQQIMDLGKVSTGATLAPPTGDFVNGNDEAYRTSFDSGRLKVDLPEGALLRVRWMADLEAETEGWVFGLDNVSLGMFADPIGDFDQDGMLTVKDIDLLTAQIAAEIPDLTFDLSGDGTVDDADLTKWRTDAATHNEFGEAYLVGDSNLDGTVDANDLNSLALNWGKSVAEWSGGDYTANGVVDSGDLNALALNWQRSIPMPSAVSAAVPEPSGWFLTVVGLVMAWRPRRR